MTPRFILALSLSALVASSALAADLPKIPSKPIAVKKELLFSDDFEGATRPKEWHRVVDTFTFEDGMLKGTQTRVKTIPAADGKPEITAHAAVYGLEVPTKDSIVECKIKLDGATMMDVEFDDRKFTGCHYGHICRAQVKLDGVTIIDEKDGNMKNEIRAMPNGPDKWKLLTGRQVTFPAKFEAGKWHDLVVELAGDEIRVSVDGKRVAFLKSSGIGHETKSKIELGVAGQSGFFDDVKVWNAAPAK